MRYIGALNFNSQGQPEKIYRFINFTYKHTLRSPKSGTMV